MRRGCWYNIFLPRQYNDGRDVEQRKFDITSLELVERFGGMTAFQEPAFTLQGFWRFRGYLFQERLAIFGVFTEEVNAAREFLVAIKPKWKRRFRQEEIFIVEVGVELV